MARPERLEIQNGANGWDATVNANFQLLFDSPFPCVYVAGDLTALEAAFPAAQYAQCLAVYLDGTLQIGMSDGSSWSALPVPTHNHDGDYAALSHDHDADYAGIAHNHDADYADIAHNHDADYAAIVHNHDSDYAPIDRPMAIPIAVSDETTALTTGTAKVTFRMPFAMTLTAVRASLTTAGTALDTVVDINEGGTSILSTEVHIDPSEKTSTTAATAAVISDSSLADDAEITIDIDQVGTGAAGLKVYLIGTPA